jgi:hypothetical protein
VAEEQTVITMTALEQRKNAETINVAAACIIASRPEDFRGEESLAVCWARMVLRAAERSQFKKE